MVTNMYGDDLSDTEPKAFINLMFLSDDITETPVIAYNQIKSASSNAHAQLALPEEFVAPSAGYIVVYLSNESDKLTEVYFDDLLVTVNEHPVIQKADYYPFGLEIAGGYQRMTAKENRFKYNGKELIQDLDLGLYDYGARFYDPTISRFTTLDPKAETYNNWSPYLYAANDPIRFEDTNGEGPGDGLFGELVTKASNYVANKVTKTINNISKSIVKGVKDFFSDVKTSPYVKVEGGYRAQAGAAGSVKGVGLDANGMSKDIFSVNFEADRDGPSYNVNYLNKDGESHMSKGVDGGFLAAGGYSESTTIDNETGEVKEQTKSANITVGAGGALTMKAEQTKNSEATTSTAKAAGTAGFAGGVGLVGYGSIEIGIKITKEDKND